MNYLNEALFSIVAAAVITAHMHFPAKFKREPLELEITSSEYVAPPPMKDEDREYVCLQIPECEKLAEAGYYEARGEPDVGVYAVMYSILNRVHQRNYGDTIPEVVHFSNHYSYLYDGSVDKGYADQRQRSRTLVKAYQVLHGEVQNPIGNADHYHTKTITKGWSSKMQHIATIGNHKFFY